MTRRGMFGLRALWWWCLALGVAVGVAVSWAADYLFGATAAGIIATIFFTMVAILFGLIATKLQASANDIAPHQPAVNLPRYVRWATEPGPTRNFTSAPSCPAPVSSTLHERASGLTAYSDSSLSLDSDDLLDSRNKLVERLAYSISDDEYIVQIASEAGLDRAHLKLAGTPSNRWSSVIYRAEIENKERRVVQRASRISPDEPLRRAIEDYIRRRP